MTIKISLEDFQENFYEKTPWDFDSVHLMYGWGISTFKEFWVIIISLLLCGTYKMVIIYHLLQPCRLLFLQKEVWIGLSWQKENIRENMEID